MNPRCNVLSPAHGDKALHLAAALGHGGADGDSKIDREGGAATEGAGDEPGSHPNQR